MNTLSPRIVEKLAGDLGLSPNTVKKNIYLLAKKYPKATSNALAQIYAQKQGETVLRMLDKEDRKSLPSGGLPVRNGSPGQTGFRISVQTDKEPDHWYDIWWVQLLVAFFFVGIIAGTISQVLGGLIIIGLQTLW